MSYRNMTDYELKQLCKMKKLVRYGKRRFQQRPDRDYLDDLLEIGISEEEAWSIVLDLTKADFWGDENLMFAFEENSLLFKKKINDIITYIKLKIELKNESEMVICLSFHKDHKKKGGMN